MRGEREREREGNMLIVKLNTSCDTIPLNHLTHHKHKEITSGFLNVVGVTSVKKVDENSLVGVMTLITEGPVQVINAFIEI